MLVLPEEDKIYLAERKVKYLKKYICPDCGGEMEQVSRAVPNDADILIYQCTECPYSQEEEPEAEEVK